MGYWLPKDPSKRWAEMFYLAYTPVWITTVAVVQNTGWYRSWRDVGHMAYSLALFLPLWVIPLVFPCETDRGKPLHERYIFKINVWLWIFAFIQSYFGTHYFYKVLGMGYRFPITWELNGVPFMLYLHAFFFFSTYQVLMNVVWRRWRTSSPSPNPALSILLLFALGYAMAFGETRGMANDFMKDYFWYEDRGAMLKYGSIFYGGLFIIGLPFWFRIDEKPGAKMPMGRVVIEVLAANMLMLHWYDAWRLMLGPIVKTAHAASGPPFLP
jgi:cycloeucalenol cycloisomerase